MKRILKAGLAVGRFLAGMAVAGLVALTVVTADRQHQAVVALHGQIMELRAEGQMLETTVRILDAEISVDRGVGSGVIVGRDNSQMGVVYILTNHHVADHFYGVRPPQEDENGNLVPPRKATLVVEFFTGERSAKVTQVASTEAYDLALLRVETEIREVSHIHPTRLCNPHLSFLHSPGSLLSRVYAVGAGLGLPPFLTEGKVVNRALELPQETAKGMKFTRTAIQHTAPIAGGNSGGGLYAINSRTHEPCLIGINYSTGAEGFMARTNHIAFAIPVETIEKWLPPHANQLFTIQRETSDALQPRE